MAKTGATLVPPAPRPTLIDGGKQTSATAVADVAEPDTAAEEVDRNEEAIEEETAQEESSGGNGSGQKRSYNFKSPNFLDDLDFSTASKSLEDFMAEKGNPTEVMDRYLVTIV